MGIGSLVGGVVGFVVGGPPGAALGAAAGGTKAGEAVINGAGNVVKEAADFTVEVVEGFGEIIWKGGEAIIDAIGDVAKGAYNIVHGTTAFRSLRPSELQVLRPVFGGSVPYDDVVICSIIGLENRPLTLPGSMVTMKAFMLPGIGPAMTVYALARRLQEKYLLCLGMEGYNRGLNMPFDTTRGGQTLVHEMMHVWQGHNRAWQWDYVYDSVISQCKCGLTGQDAYDATAGLQFKDYMVEQQARLVENWYCGAGTDRRIKNRDIPNPAAMTILELYMDEIIRPARPHGTVTIPVTGMIGTVKSTMTVATDPKLGGFTGGVSAGGSNTGPLAGVTGPATALTNAQMQQFRQMADQLMQQAQMLKMSGNAVLRHQAMMMEAQAAQFRALGGMTYQPSGSSAGATAKPGQFVRR